MLKTQFAHSLLRIIQASVELLNEGGAIWGNVETYLIFAAALSTAGGGIFVLDLGLREYDALYLVAIYQAFLILIGSVSGVIFFHENAGMNSWWQVWMYPLSIITTVSGIVILSDKHNEPHSVDRTSVSNSNGEYPLAEKAPLIVSGKTVNHGALDSV